MKIKDLIKELENSNPESEVWVRISYPQNGEITARAERNIYGAVDCFVIEGWKDEN